MQSSPCSHFFFPSSYSWKSAKGHSQPCTLLSQRLFFVFLFIYVPNETKQNCKEPVLDESVCETCLNHWWLEPRLMLLCLLFHPTPTVRDLLILRDNPRIPNSWILSRPAAESWIFPKAAGADVMIQHTLINIFQANACRSFLFWSLHVHSFIPVVAFRVAPPHLARRTAPADTIALFCAEIAMAMEGNKKALFRCQVCSGSLSIASGRRRGCVCD